MVVRSIGAWLSLVVGSLCLLVGALALYGYDTAFNTDGFTDRVMEAYADPVVQDRIADELTVSVIENGAPDLISFRPVITGTIEAVLGSRAGTAVVRAAVADLHRTLFTTDGDTVTLGLTDALILVAEAIEPTNPEAAEQLLEAEAGLVQVANREATADIITFGESLGVVAIILPLVGLALLVLAMILWRPRRLGLIAAAGSVAIVGVLLAVAAVVGRAVLLISTDEASRPIVAAVWDAFMGELVVWGVGLAAVGAVLALAARNVLKPVDVRGLLHAVGRTVADPPGGPVGQLMRAIVAVTLGLALLFRPSAVLAAFLIAGGVLVLAWGLSELLRLLFPSGGPEAELAHGRRAGLRLAVGIVAIGALVIMGVAFATQRGPDPPRVADVDACNGHKELCDRTVDEVVFAGTHNSMAAAEVPDWFLANHAAWIPKQLDAGYRALLIDTWAGWPTTDDSGVITDTSGEDAATDEFDDEPKAAAERTRQRLTPTIDQDARDLFLCHGFCELGAIPLEDGLREIQTFLLQNPNEVLIIFVEDHTEPAATAAAFEAAGLGDQAWTVEDGADLPTLREMIDSGKRIIVMAENDTEGAPDWYHDGFSLTQETPFSFDSPEALAAPESCRPNRGEPDSPLFQMNHWVQRVAPPLASDAEVVNQREFLLERARRCEMERGLLPNIVAVDFHERGDTLDVVDELNGVDPPG
ncbi:MAG: hypothetical protein ACR2N6_02295 [Miltoncostaeaceae bacterium]